MDEQPKPGELLKILAQTWWQPPAELIATLPGRGGGPALSYLGHADTTRALIETDPHWSWEPMGFDDQGQPVVVRDDRGNPVGIWIWLTVCGVRRPAYGSCVAGKNEAVKELIGDAIRNGAMRFGVAGGLWSKADRSSDEQPKPKKAPPAGKDATQFLEEQLPKEKLKAVSDPDDPEPFTGKAAYDAMVKEHGEEIVNGALATFKVAKFSELTPPKVKVIQASLISRARLVREETERAQQLAREQVEAKGKAHE